MASLIRRRGVQKEQDYQEACQAENIEGFPTQQSWKKCTGQGAEYNGQSRGRGEWVASKKRESTSDWSIISNHPK